MKNNKYNETHDKIMRVDNTVRISAGIVVSYAICTYPTLLKGQGWGS